MYSVEIGLGQFKWSVNRRFSEFASLHDEVCRHNAMFSRLYTSIFTSIYSLLLSIPLFPFALLFYSISSSAFSQPPFFLHFFPCLHLLSFLFLLFLLVFCSIQQLVAQHKLRDVELPAKRIFNNQSVTFVQRRQKELEEYLRGLFKIYPRPPPPLSRFTLWDKYVSFCVIFYHYFLLKYEQCRVP